jgi:hypothetical protein
VTAPRDEADRGTRVAADLLMCIGLLSECVQIENDHRPAEYDAKHSAFVHALYESANILESVARGQAPRRDCDVPLMTVIRLLDVSRGGEAVVGRVHAARSMLEQLAAVIGEEQAPQRLH